MKYSWLNSSPMEVCWPKYVDRFFEQKAETYLKVWRLLQSGLEPRGINVMAPIGHAEP